MSGAPRADSPGQPPGEPPRRRGDPERFQPGAAGDLPPEYALSDPERFQPGAAGDLPPEYALSRLPVGRHGLPRSFVIRNQRLRLIAAMLEVLQSHGYHGATIGDVTREAGVSRAAFYEQFAGKQECFLATYDVASHWLCEQVEEAVADHKWPGRVRIGVSQVLRLLAANPAVAQLTVEAMQAGPAARERQQAFLARFAQALREGRPHRNQLPEELEEMLLGGAISLIARYVETGRTAQLPEAAPELIQYLLIPYLEPGEPRRIAAEAA